MKNVNAPDTAYALGREINRQMRAIEARRGATDDEDGGNPFAGVTRGKTDDARKLRNLVGARNDLGAAVKRYAVVEAAYHAACAELAEASALACNVIGVDLKEIETSLANVGAAPTTTTEGK